MAKKVLPIIRSEIAKLLVNRHSLTQTAAAGRLGITQAAVSWYIANKRAINTPVINNKQFNLTEIYSDIEHISQKLAECDEYSFTEFKDSICRICQKLEISNRGCGTKKLN